MRDEHNLRGTERGENAMKREATTDYTGFEKYLDSEKQYVRIPEKKCVFIRECALSREQTLAVFKTGSRFILLGRCGTGTPGYITCYAEHIMELDYKSTREMLADRRWNQASQNYILEIDDMAYGRYCDLYR